MSTDQGEAIPGDEEGKGTLLMGLGASFHDALQSAFGLFGLFPFFDGGTDLGGTGSEMERHRLAQAASFNPPDEDWLRAQRASPNPFARSLGEYSRRP